MALPMDAGPVTYGPPGTVTTDFGPGTNAGAATVLIQPDGKIIAAGSANVVSPDYPQEFALVRYNTDGSLDTTFGSGGLVTTQFPQKGTTGNYTWINSLALQSNGEILAAGGYNGPKGSGKAGTGESFALARYNADGSLDTTFNKTGLVLTAFSGSGGMDTASAVVMEPVGTTTRAVAVGTTQATVTGPGSFALARYNANGSLDTSFGGTGKVTTSFGGSDRALAATALANGQILVVGSDYNATTGAQAFAIARYNPNGSLDTTFGTSGTGKEVIPAPAGWYFGSSATSVAFEGNLVVVAGREDANGTSYMAACQLDLATGTLDTAFASGGMATAPVANSIGALGESVAIQTGGSIDLVGYGPDAQGNQGFDVAQFTSNGTLDSSFGTSGQVITLFDSAYRARAFGVALQTGGSIVVAGFALNSGSQATFALARYTTAGALDTTF